MTCPDIYSMKILIVDDIPRNIQVLGSILQNKGYPVSFATSGSEALLMVKSESFDLILLDIMMPEMDGFVVCRHLKADPQTNDIPIIFLTAKVENDSIVEGFEHGAVDYITKPFNKDELLARVKTQLTLRRIAKDLMQSEQQLRTANEMKDKFFSIIAHDLKNPFNVLMSMSQLLLYRHDKLSDEKKREYADMIFNTTRHMERLVDNLLQWARLRSGRVQSEPKLIDLDAIARETMLLLSAAATGKDIRLESAIREGTTVYADPNMVSAVIRNLVSNAIKYTKANGEVRISSEMNGAFEDISITDTGIGISESDVDKLFRIDVTFSRPGTAMEQGTGFGLILCREFVEMNGGEIRVASREDKGSVFSFTLPLAPPESEDPTESLDAAVTG